MRVALAWSKRPFSWTTCLVILGLALRLYHYVRDPSMWHDEAALVLNVLGKGFRELLGPLLFSEAAPPLFLWLEKAASLMLADGTYVLRLLPLLASGAALVLFAPLARRVLQPRAVPWAVMLFACSDHLLWHACEAKPYSVDVLAAVLVLALFLFTRSWSVSWQLTIYTFLAPVLIFLVYPSCFLYGTLLIVLLPVVWRAKKPEAWLAYGGLMLTVAGAFIVLLAGPVHAQRNAALMSCWEGMKKFPSWQQPWTVPGWTLIASLDVLRYCSEPAGQVLAPIAVVGAVCLWRRRRDLLVFLVLPLFLALLAAYAKAYPYGGSRIMVFAAPALLLLVAEGVPVVLGWLRRRVRLAGFALTAFLLAPAGKAAYHVAYPWKRPDAAGAVAYVLAHRQPTDAVLGNKWEHWYYLRHLDPEFIVPDPAAGCAPVNRLWMVASAATAAERADWLRIIHLDGNWATIELHDFAQTTVVLKQRCPDFSELQTSERTHARPLPIHPNALDVMATKSLR